jgi:hypothetical protein
MRKIANNKDVSYDDKVRILTILLIKLAYQYMTTINVDPGTMTEYTKASKELVEREYISYKRDFEYSFIETLKLSLYMFNRLPPHTKYHKNFYWRHLYYTLYTYFDVNIKTSLNNFLPKSLSPTICFICQKRQN